MTEGCNRKMGRWEQRTGWQKDRQINRQKFRMTDRQTRVITESQKGKMAGRNKVRKDSNIQISNMKER